jgi:hypothetical protein
MNDPAITLLLQTSIRWIADRQVPFQYRPESDADSLCLRLNEFPEEPLYCLLIDDVAVAHFDDLPIGWVIVR